MPMPDTVTNPCRAPTYLPCLILALLTARDHALRLHAKAGLPCHPYLVPPCRSKPVRTSPATSCCVSTRCALPMRACLVEPMHAVSSPVLSLESLPPLP